MFSFPSSPSTTFHDDHPVDIYRTRLLLPPTPLLERVPCNHRDCCEKPETQDDHLHILNCKMARQAVFKRSEYQNNFYTFRHDHIRDAFAEVMNMLDIQQEAEVLGLGDDPTDQTRLDFQVKIGFKQ